VPPRHYVTLFTEAYCKAHADEGKLVADIMSESNPAGRGQQRILSTGEAGMMGESRDPTP
jgi:hypothetical protein